MCKELGITPKELGEMNNDDVQGFAIMLQETNAKKSRDMRMAQLKRKLSGK